MPARIAVFEDLPSGGGRRSLQEILTRLHRRYELELFTLSTAADEFCPLTPYSRRCRRYSFEPGRLFSSPWGRLNQAQRLRDLWRLDRLGRRIAAEVDRGGFDLLFASPCRWTQAPLLLRHLSLPSVYLCHEIPRQLYERELQAAGNSPGPVRALLDRLDPLRLSYFALARRLDARAATCAGRILANSRFTAGVIRDTYGIEPAVCYMGVDSNRFQPTGAPRQPYLLSVGAIHPRKGFEFLIRALSLVPPSRRLSLQLVGDSEVPGERLRLQRLSAELGVELRTEVGVSDSRLLEHYNQATLMLYSPLREPLGLAPLEAMACRLPVLGVDEGGVKETVVDGLTGFRVPRDPKIFAGRLQEVLNAPDRLAEIGDNGRRYVIERWNWEGVIERLDEHFREVVAG